MNIKFLYEGANWSEPVVPSFIPWKTNIFIGLSTFQEYTSACVLMKPIDIDTVAAKFKEEFSGVPARMLDYVIQETALAAGRLPHSRTLIYWARTGDRSASLVRRQHEEVTPTKVFTLREPKHYM